MLITKVAPKYPKQARKKHIQGTVTLHAVITKQGEISDLQLVSGDPMLAEAAMDAVKGWKYRPYLKDGERVEVETTIQVNFKLSN
jgi:periplasmic protein TonB